MLALALLLLLSGDRSDRGQHIDARCRNDRRIGPNGNCGSSVHSIMFEFAPADGAGMGAVCACTAIAASNGQPVVFTRASAAECYSNDGQTLTQCASDLPRVSSGDSASSVSGIWVENAATNSLLRSRDLANAAWVKTDVTCTKTATGMRNDVNGASTCTADVGGGTVLQTVVIASAGRTTSFHLKRRTGVGTVELTRDGVTFLDVTASLSSVVWRRAVAVGVSGCIGGNCIVNAGLTSSVANPVIGIRLGTAGDAVDLDFIQDEVGGTGNIPTSPIESAGTAVTRAIESATVAVAIGAGGGVSIFATGVNGTPITGKRLLNWETDTNNRVSLGQLTGGLGTALHVNAGVSSGAKNSTGFTASPSTSNRLGYFVGDGSKTTCTNGGCAGNATAVDAPARTTIFIGTLGSTSGDLNWDGVVKLVCMTNTGNGCR